ncbi:DUF4163 domain-containing protein [Aurantiacibacter sediminis]|uniref:DUF4163 domain-containing protein n=1 Tax=Aurantiacibacter sediminis TaxID=2793064 RepID=A0ABS0N6A5_9SPHN|nr:DUF4163 domain-containing protein [Aurantiacibacter sediminis]MBH5323311.1 DUF4163 domain-containing protein [Aurantiacibacter sediminis]
MQRITWLLVPALLLAGCDALSGRGETAPPDAPARSDSGAAPNPSLPVPVGGAREVSEQTDTFLFDYSYPQEAGEIPALALWLDGRMDEKRQRLATEAARGSARARSNGFPFNSYSSETAWEVVSNLPDWLSMSATLSSYEGGAHPNYGFDTMVWDKQGDAPIEPIAFFTSPEALDEALGERLCEALNMEREQRRGIPVDPQSDDIFDTCVMPDETNLLLGSTNGEFFDRIGIQIAPYLAGPYSEGSYEFTFEVDDQIRDIVRPEYAAAFQPPE